MDKVEKKSWIWITLDLVLELVVIYGLYLLVFEPIESFGQWLVKLFFFLAVLVQWDVPRNLMQMWRDVGRYYR
jgi:hypothetical protein